jgi:hypothetical protein
MIIKMKKYNFKKENLILKEYGRNIQKLIKNVSNIKNKKLKIEHIKKISNLIIQINPQIKNSTEYSKKLWNDIIIISNQDTDIKKILLIKKMKIKKPEKLNYKNKPIKLKHYGRNIELMIKKISEIKSKEKKENMIINILYLIKNFNSIWKNNINDELKIIENIKKISNSKLNINIKNIKIKINQYTNTKSLKYIS